MSKPNRLQFGTAVGYYRNPKVRHARLEVGKKIDRKVSFRELTPMLFQILFSAAAENAIEGDFTGYTTEDFQEIYAANFVPMDRNEVGALLKIFQDQELMDGLKIRSWKRFNPHLAEDESNQRQRKMAGKLSAKKRQMEARAALKRAGISAEDLDENPEKHGSGTESRSKQLWLLNQAIASAKGKARRELERQREALISQVTGVDLSEPPPPPALPAPKPKKQTAAQFQSALLNSARSLVASDSAELLTESMAQALHNAGEEVPEAARRKFPKLLAELEDKNARDNPVPG